MTQYVIDIGAAPNDGTGDPLRTAFNETNLNFDQVFAAGPVLSNVRIANNSILTVTTNGNLILAPNGTGVVQSNVHIVPNTSNLRNLGSALQRWNTVYTQYVDVSGPATFDQLTVTGNLTVNGNIIQIGNLVTDAKTIQLSNTAGTANAANGSGITVGANDNIATFLYTSGANRWNTNIGLQVAGLANVATLQVNQTANAWFIAGNIITAPSGAIWLSDPEFLDEYINSARDGYINMSSLYANGNTASQVHLEHGLAQIVVDNGSENIWAFDSNGNLTLPGNTFAVNYANGNPVIINSSSYGNANVATFLANFGSNTISTTGNITSNGLVNVNSLRVNQTANAWNISGNTITAPSRATWISDPVFLDEYITSARDGYINLTSLYANGNTASQVHLEHNVAQIVVNNGSEYIWAFDNAGNLTAPGNISTSTNITANNFIGLMGNITNLDSVNFAVENIGALVGNNGVNIGAGGNNNLVVLPTEVLIQNVPLTVAGNILSTVANGLNITANTVANGVAQTWNFGTDGRLTFPGTPRIATDSDNFEVQAAESINFEANAVVNIYTDTSGTTYQWQFGDDGNLTLPVNGDLNFNGGSIAQTLNEDFYIRASDDEADGWSIYNVVDDGAGNTLSHTRLEFDQYTIRTDAQGAAYTWAFRDTGVLDLPGDIYGNVGGNLTVKIGDSAGSDTFIDLQTRSYVGDALISNIRIANPNVTVSTASGVYNWNFDNTGNLNLPLSGNLVGTTPNNNGYINWLGNSSGDLNGYTTMRLVPDDTRESSDQYLIVDPTAPGHIHIRAGGTQDNSGADLFLGGENSYFRVASGANSAASVSANSYVWTYGTDGTFSLPAAESPGQYSEITSVGNSSGDGNGYATLQLKPDSNVGGDSYLIIDPTAPNHIHIRAGGAQDNSGAQLFLGGENSYFLVENGANSNVYVASNSNQWKFDTTGILTLPGEGVLQSLNDTVTLSSLNTTTGNANSVYLGSSGGLGFNDQEAGGNWLEIFRSGSDPEIRVPPGGGNILITGASGSGGAGGRNITITAGPADQTNYYTTAGGTVNIVGGLGATDDGGGGGPGGNVNITAGVSADPAGHAGNVKIACGPNSWVFDYSGNVTLPGNINAVLASPAPSLNGFNNVNAVNVNASGNISGTTAGYAIGYRDIPQVAFTGNATIATTDAGKHFYSTQSSNYILTIANNASQGFQVGAAITVVNQGTGTISIAQGSGVTLYLAGNATSGNRTVATFGMATIIKVATDTWFINGTGVS
jgi:hypothetical protein